MGKTEEADMFNCTSCGYGSCEDMAVAIHNGLNKPENCHHFMADQLVVAHHEHEGTGRVWPGSAATRRRSSAAASPR